MKVSFWEESPKISQHVNGICDASIQELVGQKGAVGQE